MSISALVPILELPLLAKCWNNSVGPLYQSLLWAAFMFSMYEGNSLTDEIQKFKYNCYLAFGTLHVYWVIEEKVSSFLGIPVVLIWSFSIFHFVILSFSYSYPHILLPVILVLFPCRFPVSLYCPTSNDLFIIIFFLAFLLSDILSPVLCLSPYPPCVSHHPLPHTSHLFGRQESDLVSINLNLLPHYCLLQLFVPETAFTLYLDSHWRSVIKI